MTSLRRRAASVAAATAAVAAVGALAAGPAGAATSARAGSGSVSAASGSWAAAPAAVGGTPSGSAYVLTWTVTTTVQYLQVANTGTLSLTGQTYTATNSTASNGTTAPSVELDACVGATWNTTLGTCAGTLVVLTTTAKGATASTTALATGASLSVRALPASAVKNNVTYTTTVSVAVSRAQARAGTTSNA